MGSLQNLITAMDELAIAKKIFMPNRNGARPCHGTEQRYASDPYWKDLLLFHEYFHGDTGRGLGASHQTGWTTLAVRLIEDLAK